MDSDAVQDTAETNEGSVEDPTQATSGDVSHDGEGQEMNDPGRQAADGVSAKPQSAGAAREKAAEVESQVGELLEALSQQNLSVPQESLSPQTSSRSSLSPIKGRPPALSPISPTKGLSPTNRAHKEKFSMQRSQFGNQTDSGKRSSAAFSFGSADRFRPAQTQYISREHANAMVARGVPGPGTYKAAGSLGKQTMAEKTTKPEFRFGTSSRFDWQTQNRNPGPAHYEARSGVGAQAVSTKETGPVVSFPQASRDVQVSVGKGFEEHLHGHGSPGPANYKTGSSFGLQTVSGKGTSAAVTFGINTRAAPGNSIEERRSARLPGPGAYAVANCLGASQDSLRVNSPKFPFGIKTERKLSAAEDTPGFSESVPSLGPQALSPKKNASAFRYGTEARFGVSVAIKADAPGPGSYRV